MHQLRIAETEKYAHVTYFFNGGEEEPFPGEDRILIESPRDVATYDLKPSMSAVEVTDKLLAAFGDQAAAGTPYDLVILNFANGDMLGHTGILQAGCEKKLTLITSPAGYGKTTLVSDWLAQCNTPHAWLTLDRDDNDLRLFHRISAGLDSHALPGSLPQCSVTERSGQ